MNTNYSYINAKGYAGLIDYQSPRHIVARSAEAAISSGFGIFVVAGTTAGKTVKVPSATTDAIEGVLVNHGTIEQDASGNVAIPAKETCSVMRYGHVWVKLDESEEPDYGDAVYVVASGATAGCATTDDDGTIPVAGRFISGAEDGIALVELFDQAQPAAISLSDLADISLSSPSNGQVLKYNGTDKVWENAADAT